MNNDLNRSLRMLEETLLNPRPSLFKNEAFKTRAPSEKDVNLSLTMLPHEIQLLADGNYSMFTNTFGTFIDTDKTLTGSIIRANEPWKTTLDILYIEFLEIMQTHAESRDILDVVSDLARCCSDALNVVKGMKSKVSARQVHEDETWLANERSTWRLIYVLYQDRLSVQRLQVEEGTDTYFGLSEKLCIENLFKRDGLVRESQLVIDWLERNGAENDDETLHFSDSTVGWENTLHQLKSKDTIVFGSSGEIVTSLDPDAPTYQGRPLHDLDAEDEKRLCRRVFREIRCGKLNEAQKLCQHCGHSWRAAMLEGWRLHHDPNIREETTIETAESELMDQDSNTEDEYGATVIKPVEGNANRDIWKMMALKYCEEPSLSNYDKAAVAAYCGRLNGLLPVCDTWEDYLWAYMRVIVDIRVESEIRDYVNKSYKQLPNTYWDQKMSLNDVFTCLESSKNKAIQLEANMPQHRIQKHIILDEIAQVFDVFDDLLDNDGVSTQFLRFATHLMLFLEQIGHEALRRNTIEKVLEAYIRRLMKMQETQIVAYYVSKMGPPLQTTLYSSYLEEIIDDEERKECLMYAENCSLNVEAITKTVVENIRNRPMEIGDLSLHQQITPGDELKISAIDWLLYYETQRPEAIIQSNALIFKFLTVNKIDAAQLVFNKIPINSVELILSEGDAPEFIGQAVREHLSYKAYLDAQEAFNDWFKLYKSKPEPPKDIAEDSHLTKKVAYQHRMSQYKAETERWKLTISHLAKSAKALLYNVLLFPDGGWLSGAKDGAFLQSTCIPECMLLLYTVLSESGFYNECIQLANILASEKYKLYKVYAKEKLEEILNKLNETSLELLNRKMDPWGNDTPA